MSIANATIDARYAGSLRLKISFFLNNFTFYKWCVTKVAHCTTTKFSQTGKIYLDLYGCFITGTAIYIIFNTNIMLIACHNQSTRCGEKIRLNSISK